ncbi:hypothetical protein BCR37DRAFT_90865 [Protomyces lactucae-debilis]|uniref:Uncharacterized protein n=1 Tax=Protomyces lactucae-debilis TaxID=2754530 RepID=A0A1Y2F6D4_PROLT|nr:uncharacterized protein BCR37DRAFT_90865 [Protomyces lactucae-debilis]ORY79441.1 hypothetical protein BCR37DRAFT_90865 [Protomyces lactucae-debilis]
MMASNAKGHLALSLLLFLQQGGQAKEPDCKMLAVRAETRVTFESKVHPACGQCWSFGTSRDKELEAISCPDVCDERIADLMYDTSKYRLDPCIHVMKSDNLSQWDILFRNPNGRDMQSTAPGLKICQCAVTIIVQRLVNQVTDTNPQQSTLNTNYCVKPEKRIVEAKLKIINDNWYPALSRLGEESGGTKHDVK